MDFFFSRRISTSKVTVLGYGLLTKDAETLIDALNNQKFKVVIVDESHYMKSRNATRSKILLPIVQKAKRAILLTGTPALGRPEEVLKSLNFGLKKHFHQKKSLEISRWLLIIKYIVYYDCFLCLHMNLNLCLYMYIKNRFYIQYKIFIFNIHL